MGPGLSRFAPLEDLRPSFAALGSAGDRPDLTIGEKHSETGPQQGDVLKTAVYQDDLVQTPSPLKLKPPDYLPPFLAGSVPEAMNLWNPT